MVALAVPAAGPGEGGRRETDCCRSARLNVAAGHDPPQSAGRGVLLTDEFWPGVAPTGW